MVKARQRITRNNNIPKITNTKKPNNPTPINSPTLIKNPKTPNTNLTAINNPKTKILKTLIRLNPDNRDKINNRTTKNNLILNPNRMPFNKILNILNNLNILKTK